MGNSLFKKIVLIFFAVLSINTISIYFLTKSVNLEANKIDSNFTQVVSINTDLEENGTLTQKYNTVAAKIQEYTKKSSKKEIQIENDLPVLGEFIISDSNIRAKEEELVIVDSEVNDGVEDVLEEVSSLPKLAIIIDDISFYHHADSIKRLPFPVTPSIFPPTKLFPHTKEIAEDLGFYMIHFPMEAKNYSNRIENAIKVSDSKAVLKKRIDQVMKDLPNAVAINNHTGSKFTCNYKAMSDFFSILQEYDIEFLDSKTSSGTQCVRAGEKFNKKVVQRDIFLDNKNDVTYIKNQLKEAVRVAKEQGEAIAICHPRVQTFQALMDSSEILKDVELVYIDELL